MFKKIIICVMIVTIAFSFSGCIIKSKTNINFKENVTVLGIDEEDGKVKLTILLKLIQPLDDSGSGSQKSTIYTSEGETIFDAIRNFHTYTDKDIFWGHLDFVLVGEKTAKEGITKYLDLLVRDHEIKQNARLVITKRSTAYDFITKTDRKVTSLNDILTSLFADVEALSQSSEVTIQDYAKMMNSNCVSLYLPTASMVDFSEKPEDEKDKKDVKLSGYAIFDEDKLIGYLNGKTARGFNWAIDEIGTGIIVIEDMWGDKLSLEIIECKTDIKIDFYKQKPYAKIEICFSTNIGEYHGKRDIFHQDMIGMFIDAQNEAVEKEIESAVKYLQRKKTDCIGICDCVYHKDPVISKNFEPKWAEVFSEMSITVDVKSTINRSYNIKEPVGTK